MSFLPAGSSLRSFLPDLDDLLEDPAAYLGVGPVVVGPRRMYRLAALFAIPGIAFIVAYAFGTRDPERIALGVGMLIGSAIWFGWSLWARGDSLILHRDGVEVKYHDVSAWCPWALFNADGVVHVPEVDSPFAGPIVPVAADAIPFIELRRDGTVIAHGAQVRTKRFVIRGDNEVVLLGRYEVADKDLGDLLLHVGRTLGHALPRGAPPPEAYRAEPEQVADPDLSGWITARAARFRFPPVCCGCGHGTGDAMRFHVSSRAGSFMRVLVPVAAQEGHEVAIAVPVCAKCQAEVRARQTRGAVHGLVVGSLLGPLVLVLGEWVFHWGNALSGMAALAIAAAGALVGFGIGNAVAFRPPVQVRDYSATSGTVRLRFRDPEYGAAVVARMRQQQTPM